MSTVISVPERFDFGFHKQYSELMNNTLSEKESGAIKIDFSVVQYIDSSALGMLVMFCKRAKAQGRSFEIINASGAAREVLKIANFDRLMKIS